MYRIKYLIFFFFVFGVWTIQASSWFTTDNIVSDYIVMTGASTYTYTIPVWFDFELKNIWMSDFSDITIKSWTGTKYIWVIDYVNWLWVKNIIFKDSLIIEYNSTGSIWYDWYLLAEWQNIYWVYDNTWSIIQSSSTWTLAHYTPAEMIELLKWIWQSPTLRQVIELFLLPLITLYLLWLTVKWGFLIWFLFIKKRILWKK